MATVGCVGGNQRQQSNNERNTDKWRMDSGGRGKEGGNRKVIGRQGRNGLFTGAMVGLRLFYGGRRYE